jgi:CBS domain containing-hemolysin-like protein
VELGRAPTLYYSAEAIVLAAVLLAFFAVAVPHALAIHAGEAILMRSLPLLAGQRLLFLPFTRMCDAIEFVVRRLLGRAEVTEEEESERAEQEILDAVSEGEAHGAVDEDQKEMIESVFELDETQVSAIMTPRTDINAVPITATYDEVRAAILEQGHSRIPVYDDSIDHIVGVVYAKDLLKLDPQGPFEARQIMRKVPYVPETKTLDELLDEFRSNKVQLAIVLDEYGGTAGLVTIEDILEELVGEIDDEYDQTAPPAIIRVDEDTLEVDGRVHVSEVNEELEVKLPEEEDYETIGGFVFATLGKIPAVGEEFSHENIRFQITAAETRKINRLRIHVNREVESA